MDQKQIIIMSLPFDMNDADTIFKMKKDDAILSKAVTEYIHQNRLEIFEQQNNIAATNKGFLAAFYEDDIESVEIVEKTE